MRDEAERLVAAAIAAVSYATRGLGSVTRPGSGFATGSAECCICPVCRAIAAMRDPAPELADKLAAGVGDLASGLASILRTLSQRGPSSQPAEEPAAAEGDEFWESLRRKAADAAKAAARNSTVEDDPWHTATADEPATTATTTPAPAPKPMAKKAVAKKVAATATPVAKKTPPRRAPRPDAGGDA
jgi:hypothetical protein